MSDYNRYAPTPAWGDDLFDVTTPSGQVCQVRKLDMIDLVELDLVDKFDSLTPVVGKGPEKKAPADRKKSKAALAREEEEAQASFAKDLMKDKEKFRQLVNSIDLAVERAIVQPEVRRPVKTLDTGQVVELPRSEREPGVIYTSQIGFEDKMHIFDAVFSGVADLEPFREEPTDSVGDVAKESSPKLRSVGSDTD